MATEEPAVVIETAEVQVEAELPQEEKPAAKSPKAKKTKEPKAKKPATPRKRNPPTHPPYLEVLFLICQFSYRGLKWFCLDLMDY